MGPLKDASTIHYILQAGARSVVLRTAALKCSEGCLLPFMNIMGFMEIILSDNKNVKQSHYTPGQALWVKGG
jgi:hypothetical protein